jgi:ribonucleoside-diphosphate reductase beta chain
MSQEPLTREQEPFYFFPIKHRDILEWYKKMEASFWTAEEIRRDHKILNDWNNIQNKEGEIFYQTYSSFLLPQMERANEKLMEKLRNEVQ